jgi:hypothetical protein
MCKYWLPLLSISWFANKNWVSQAQVGCCVDGDEYFSSVTGNCYVIQTTSEQPCCKEFLSGGRKTLLTVRRDVVYTLSSWLNKKGMTRDECAWGACRKVWQDIFNLQHIICLYVGNQMPTSVSYLSNKQTHLNIWGRIITRISWMPRVSLWWYWNIFFVIKWFYLFLPFNILC